MPKNPFEISLGNPFEEPTKKKKRAKLSASQRIYIWEHPKLYGRRCNICGQRITKMSELELDHTRAHSKGGKRLALAHPICNRMKGTKSLGYVQKKIGTKTSKRRTTKKRKTKKSRQSNPFDFNIKPIKVPNPFKF